MNLFKTYLSLSTKLCLPALCRESLMNTSVLYQKLWNQIKNFFYEYLWCISSSFSYTTLFSGFVNIFSIFINSIRGHLFKAQVRSFKGQRVEWPRRNHIATSFMFIFPSRKRICILLWKKSNDNDMHALKKLKLTFILTERIEGGHSKRALVSSMLVILKCFCW